MQGDNWLLINVLEHDNGLSLECYKNNLEADMYKCLRQRFLLLKSAVVRCYM